MILAIELSVNSRAVGVRAEFQEEEGEALGWRKCCRPRPFSREGFAAGLTHARWTGAYHVWWQAARGFSARLPYSLTRDPRAPISVRWLPFRPGVEMRRGLA